MYEGRKLKFCLQQVPNESWTHDSLYLITKTINYYIPYNFKLIFQQLNFKIKSLKESYFFHYKSPKVSCCIEMKITVIQNTKVSLPPLDWGLKHVWPRIVMEYFGVAPSACLSSSSVGHVCSPSIGLGSTSDCSDSWKAGSARASSFMSSSIAFVSSSLSYKHMQQNEGQNYGKLTSRAPNGSFQ